MAGRFTRLEFGEEGKRQRHTESHEVHGTPVRDATHYVALAVEARRLGRFESALQSYTRAVREDRAIIPAWVGQVQMLVELGEFAEARLWSDKALELFRDNGELLAAKSQACVRQGDTAAGLAFSDASLRSQGSSPWRWEARGEALLAREGERGGSMYRTCFQKALSEPAADWFDRVIIASMLLFHHRAAAALEFAQQAVTMQSNHPYNWLLLGRCQAALGWDEQAETTFRRCLELTPRLDDAARSIEALADQTSTSRFVRRIRNWFRR